MENADTNENTQRSLSWTAGLSAALGVPLLIIPSIEYFAKYLGGISVALWIISIAQGFIQNLAYGEMAVNYPKVNGLPGCAQEILGKTDKTAYRFLGGFCAWGYWFAWAPIPSIFSISITEFLLSVLPIKLPVPKTVLNIFIGSVILWQMFFSNRRGLQHNAVKGYILNFISIVPLIIIAALPFAEGKADLSRVFGDRGHMLFSLKPVEILLTFGLFAMAQWSACAWETAAIYAPEYKNPAKDTMKALVSCGLICLAVFVLIQASCISTFGASGSAHAEKPILLMLAEAGLGEKSVLPMAAIIIAAMLSIIQTGFSGASRAIYSMAKEGNFPAVFKKLNRCNMPQNAMLLIVLLNYALIITGSSSALVAASSVGYCLANGICLFAYTIYKSGSKKRENTRFSLPYVWMFFAAALAVLNLVCYIAGLIYLNMLDYGMISISICMIVILSYFPIYFFVAIKGKEKR